MKVCTDACLFGAVVADKIYREQNNVSNLLDIGAGTGLLSLQVAQKTTATIDSVEIDKAAFEYCTDNAAMIAITAHFKYLENDFSDLSISPSPRAVWA